MWRLTQTFAYTATYSMQLKAVSETHVDMYQFDRKKDHVTASWQPGRIPKQEVKSQTLWDKNNSTQK